MGLYYTKTNSYNGEVHWGRVVATFIAFVVISILWSAFAAPQIRVYRQDLEGQANLRQQEWEKQILIEQAKAERESAILQAEADLERAKGFSNAEIERARGVSEANQIIAGGLKDNEEYLQYLWITNLNSQGQVIYVPTEAGLPILEAGKR